MGAGDRHALRGSGEHGAVAVQVFLEQTAAPAAGDLETCMGHYGDDVVVVDPQHPEPRRGPVAVRKDIHELLTACPDARFETRRLVAQDDAVAAELLFTGTNSGPPVLPAGRPVR